MKITTYKRKKDAERQGGVFFLSLLLSLCSSSRQDERRQNAKHLPLSFFLFRSFFLLLLSLFSFGEPRGPFSSTERMQTHWQKRNSLSFQKTRRKEEKEAANKKTKTGTFVWGCCLSMIHPKGTGETEREKQKFLRTRKEHKQTSSNLSLPFPPPSLLRCMYTAAPAVKMRTETKIKTSALVGDFLSSENFVLHRRLRKKCLFPSLFLSLLFFFFF